LGWTFIYGDLDPEYKSFCSIGTPSDTIHSCVKNSINTSDSFAFSLEGGTDYFLTDHDIVVKCRELSIAHKILMLSLF